MIKEKFNLKNKVAIVTGASKGIGEAIARGLAEFGANVVVSSRKQEAVEKVASEFNSEGLSSIAIECHVAKEDQQKNLIKKVLISAQDFLPSIIIFTKLILFNSGNHLLAVLLDILLIISISNVVFS